MTNVINTACLLNNGHYAQKVKESNAVFQTVEKTDGRPAALRLCQELHRDAGFAPPAVSEATRRRLVDADNRRPPFFVQTGTDRASRFAGRGRQQPPPGRVAINGGCFLCAANVMWMQCYNEVPYCIRLGGRPWNIYPNPYPYVPDPFVVASDDHISQDMTPQRGPTDVVADLVELIETTPGWVAMLNGVGAGASIPSHQHFQLYERWGGTDSVGEPFPLERWADAADNAGSAVALIRDYPITAIAVRGGADDIIAETSRLLTLWTQVAGGRASANLAVTHDGTTGKLCLYFVPRNRNRPYAAGLKGACGGLEVLGELVLSSEDEFRRLDSGEIDYAYVRRVLAEVEPDEAAAFVARAGLA